MAHGPREPWLSDGVQWQWDLRLRQTAIVGSIFVESGDMMAETYTAWWQRS